MSPLYGFAASIALASVAAADDFDPLPLTGHTRQVTFTAEEGTWISVDQTPDGRSLVFDLLGDLYSLPRTGGDAIALTRGLPYDREPRISPDGEWIAFVSDRDGADNLWVMRRADGELRRLSSHRQSIAISPSWTPDSRRVLVAETSSYLLRSEARFSLYALSGEASPVLDHDGKAVKGSGGVISADGQYLYFAQRDAVDEELYGMPLAQIRRLDLHRGTVETLTNGPGGGTRPVISADGRLLVYATREEGRTALRMRHLESGADRLLIRSVQQDRQDYGRGLRGDHLPGYVFTPDGQSLLMSYDGRIHRVALQDGQVAEVPFRANVVLDIGPKLHKPYRLEDGALTARIVHHPSFSPDGRRIAASILTKLYVMPARKGALPRRLTQSDALEFQPAWSPDGRWLAYVVWSRERGGDIWKARADGRGAPQRLSAHSAFYTDLAFSADEQADPGDARQ